MKSRQDFQKLRYETLGKHLFAMYALQYVQFSTNLLNIMGVKFSLLKTCNLFMEEYGSTRSNLLAQGRVSHPIQRNNESEVIVHQL